MLQRTTSYSAKNTKLFELEIYIKNIKIIRLDTVHGKYYNFYGHLHACEAFQASG